MYVDNCLDKRIFSHILLLAIIINARYRNKKSFCITQWILSCLAYSLSILYRDGIFNHFISRVQEKLHIVVCMSPVGDAFRSRCRMFPSLVNCCTIDWFTEWPR